ncbi:hypothetical protein H696_04740 [Fonticula alba]|uniref:Uncharacterized protein n=1 Tax=Fonticula alba TaxID=691883 RepID=A0A058Z2V3_FONAL|nr:hypothetical protein H696_04740 [Fonticula alba]KCV68446.1 hypothetical protein H696_04740 [Fonticula alba]|eukprot:XP_009496878.1 hypothetical protein H696_04740 [Fonticula alba]
MQKALLKIPIIGDGGVGKTSLRARFIHNKFNSNYKATIGVDFISKEVVVDTALAATLAQELPSLSNVVALREHFQENPPSSEQPLRITMQLWDTAGQERFQSLGTAFYRGADACVLVFDLSTFSSFDNLKKWHADFITRADIQRPNDFPFIVIGNKMDCDRSVPRTTAEAWAKSINAVYVECSARDGTHVERAFKKLAILARPMVASSFGGPKHSNTVSFEHQGVNPKRPDAPLGESSGTCCS